MTKIEFLDPFEVFERDHSHLVAVNAKGRDINRIDFFAREKEEMRELTKASEIADGVWVCHFFAS